MKSIADQMLELLPTFSPDALQSVSRLYVENVGYLDEHLPDRRENAWQFPCSDEGYHGCSFSLRHDPGCKAIGGDGDVSANGYKAARSCAADCDAAATDEPWCRVGGFDCPDCEFVDELLGMLASA